MQVGTRLRDGLYVVVRFTTASNQDLHASNVNVIGEKLIGKFQIALALHVPEGNPENHEQP